MKSVLAFFLFSLLFVLITNHHIVTTTLSGLQKPAASFEKVDNQKLSEFIQHKTDISISNFFVINSDSLFAGMTGVPGKPLLSISKEMYTTFS